MSRCLDPDEPAAEAVGPLVGQTPGGPMTPSIGGPAAFAAGSLGSKRRLILEPPLPVVVHSTTLPTPTPTLGKLNHPNTVQEILCDLRRWVFLPMEGEESEGEWVVVICCLLPS